MAEEKEGLDLEWAILIILPELWRFLSASRNAHGADYRFTITSVRESVPTLAQSTPELLQLALDKLLADGKVVVSPDARARNPQYMVNGDAVLIDFPPLSAEDSAVADEEEDDDAGVKKRKKAQAAGGGGGKIKSKSSNKSRGAERQSSCANPLDEEDEEEDEDDAAPFADESPPPPPPPPPMPAARAPPPVPEELLARVMEKLSDIEQILRTDLIELLAADADEDKLAQALQWLHDQNKIMLHGEEILVIDG